jgi:hypothetical protein
VVSRFIRGSFEVLGLFYEENYNKLDANFPWRPILNAGFALSFSRVAKGICVELLWKPFWTSHYFPKFDFESCCRSKITRRCRLRLLTQSTNVFVSQNPSSFQSQIFWDLNENTFVCQNIVFAWVLILIFYLYLCLKKILRLIYLYFMEDEECLKTFLNH